MAIIDALGIFYSDILFARLYLQILTRGYDAIEVLVKTWHTSISETHFIDENQSWWGSSKAIHYYTGFSLILWRYVKGVSTFQLPGFIFMSCLATNMIQTRYWQNDETQLQLINLPWIKTLTDESQVIPCIATQPVIDALMLSYKHVSTFQLQGCTFN